VSNKRHDSTEHCDYQNANASVVTRYRLIRSKHELQAHLPAAGGREARDLLHGLRAAVRCQRTPVHNLAIPVLSGRREAVICVEPPGALVFGVHRELQALAATMLQRDVAQQCA
jgi:hypothetical protein